MDIHNMSNDEILKIVTPIAKNMETGWDEDNYEKFTEHFSNDMKSVVNIDNYSKQRASVFTDLGNHKNIEFVTLHHNPDNVTVIWKLYCEKREIPALLICSFSDINENLKIVSAILNH